MPRIRAGLANTGIIASRKRIACLIRVIGIQGVSRRRAWCVTTQRNQRPAPDLVKRVFVAQDINELWVADMTYLPTWEGFLYLAVVTDACSSKVVGWAFGVQMTADLVSGQPPQWAYVDVVHLNPETPQIKEPGHTQRAA